MRNRTKEICVAGPLRKNVKRVVATQLVCTKRKTTGKETRQIRFGGWHAGMESESDFSYGQTEQKTARVSVLLVGCIQAKKDQEKKNRLATNRLTPGAI